MEPPPLKYAAMEPGEERSLRRSENQLRDARLKRLAADIDALSEKDDTRLRHAREIAALRRAAAAELYAACADFVASLNALLQQGELGLDPPRFSPETFEEDTPNLIQIHIRGRILQVEYAATPELVSTEDFRIPYTLQGFVRAFNQDLLDKDLIEEQLIFYTLEKDKRMWRFFDARTYRSGPFDEAYLVSLMEQII
jgi:hypothetical protein